MRALQCLTWLSCLDLSHSQIDNEMLDWIAKLPNLRQLKLNTSRLSEEGDHLDDSSET